MLPPNLQSISSVMGSQQRLLCYAVAIQHHSPSDLGIVALHHPVDNRRGVHLSAKILAQDGHRRNTPVDPTHPQVLRDDILKGILVPGNNLDIFHVLIIMKVLSRAGGSRCALLLIGWGHRGGCRGLEVTHLSHFLCVCVCVSLSNGRSQ
jgi:hypothetical protein